MPCRAPEDTWLLTHSAAMVSDNVALRQQWQASERLAVSPFEPFDYLPEGQVVLFWPKAHQLGKWWLEWLCHVLPDNTPLDIVGEHQGGIKRVPKMLDELGMSCDKLDNARRCSLFATRTVKMEAPESAWQTFDALDMRLVSHPGVFGHGKVDEGTQLLLQALEETLPKNAESAGYGLRRRHYQRLACETRPCGHGCRCQRLCRRSLPPYPSRQCAGWHGAGERCLLSAGG